MSPQSKGTVYMMITRFIGLMRSMTLEDPTEGLNTTFAMQNAWKVRNMGRKHIVECNACGPMEIDLSKHTIKIDAWPSNYGEKQTVAVTLYCPHCYKPLHMRPPEEHKTRLRAIIEEFISKFGGQK
jgi:hypothetical protein